VAARPDLVGRDFSTDPSRVDARWCGDITYVNTWEGWLYLATVIDLASRRVVGWAGGLLGAEPYQYRPAPGRGPERAGQTGLGEVVLGPQELIDCGRVRSQFGRADLDR
jgi:hypothetical protein